MKAQHQQLLPLKQFGFKALILFFLLSAALFTHAQCPPNLDFELGDFTNWQCQSGGFNGVITLAPTPPTPGRHDMLSSLPPGNGRDAYGLFTKNCPNGSGHSVKIGNEITGTTADAVSYTFTIPPGQNTYNLIYNYAIVLNDAGHTPDMQPRLLITVMNVTDGIPLPCPLDPIVVTGSLPGFFDSPNRAPNGSLVRCKDWAAASIKLDNNAGKTIQITFTVTGCGLTNGSHFGYAYIDVNTGCSSAFIGAAYCADDTAINVTAPFGYQSYTWWDAGFTTILGTNQVINFNPPPPPGTTIAVVIEPFSGYGCLDTLYADLLDTLNIRSDAGLDKLACNLTPVQIGVPPKPGHVYSWSPVTGLSNATISNPIATVSTTTQYVVTTSSAGGGCVSKDTVIVSAAVLDSSIQLLGKDTYCIGDPQAAVLRVQPADSIQWYRNGIAIPGATQTQYNVTQTGAYHATVFSFVGCSSNTEIKTINVYDNPVAGFNLNSPTSQCFRNNQFAFTNTSTIASGTIQYSWDMGDGTVLTTTDVNHSYAQAGTYTVKLMVTSGNGCKDSLIRTVNVYPSATADAVVNTNSQCFTGHQFIFTNNTTVESGTLVYNWSLGDGNIANTPDVTHSYVLPGSYTVKLLVITDKGCADSISINVAVNPSPVAGFAVNNVQQCFGGNNFVLTNTTTIFSGTVNYNWDLGDGNTATTANVNHSYLQSGDYRIRMLATSDSGCVDSSFRDVKIFAYPLADFLVRAPACINQEVLVINKTLNNTSSTLNYVWDFGNGHTEFVRSPAYSYPAPGNYNLRLSVSTAQCPATVTTKLVPVVIEAPAPGMVYPDKEAVFNFPEKLFARQIGTSVLWSPGISLDNRFSYSPVFRGINSQLYTIELKTASGCITVDTQFVKTKKKIEIYVPTVFTPGNDGLNDYLRPLLMGFDHVNYFRVYNRWGKLIFQMKSDRPGWDGRVNGQPAEMQTVVWMIEAVDVDGVTHRRQGTTVLIR